MRKLSRAFILSLRRHAQQGAEIRVFSTERVTAATDRLLVAIAYYAVPAAIVLLSAAAVVSSDSLIEPPQQRALTFRVLPDPDAALNPAEAVRRLGDQPLVAHVDTHRAEHPFWLELPLTELPRRHTVLELASRHARDATCWRADDLDTLGSADRAGTTGAMRHARGGYALQLAAPPERPAAVLCRVTHSGPARITANVWPPRALHQAEHDFQRGAGLLTGGLLTLAFFSVIMAAINREARYMLLAGWLVLNLRMSGLSLGWDTHWLGVAVPPDWLSSMRQITISLYYLVTYTLFSQFFKSDLPRVGYSWLLRIGQWSTLFLLAFALAVPYATYLPVMWATVAMGIAIMLFLVGRTLLITRSRTAIWYSAALAVVFVAYFSEIIAAALDFKLLIHTLNGVTAALASSVLVVLALAEQLRTEKRERIRAQEALGRTYEATPIGLFTLDGDGRFQRTNTAMQSILGMACPARAGERWSDHFESGAWQNLRTIAAQPGGGETELRGLPDEHGKRPWYLVRALRSGDHIEGSLQDITARVDATERLRFLANHDLLTGTYNRHGIEAALEQAAPDAAQSRPVAVAFLDLQRFKLINDLYRSQAGDEVLKQVAGRIRNALGENHDLGRIGGDEFLLVLRDTPIDEAARIGERVLGAIGDKPYRFGNQRLQVKASMGVIEFTPDMSTAGVISAAQRACREAKRGHAGPLVVYDRDASAFRESEEELGLIKLLGERRLPSGLYLVMQPLLSLRRPDESLNFEILLRMKDDDGNPVPVGKVLEAAEASGNMARLDKWVLTRTLEWLERHLPSLPRTQFVSVNFSGASLNDQSFVADVLAILARHKAVVPYLCIEITEGVALHDLQYASSFVQRLKEVGAKIALDDFGAGYTSFSYLRNLQADALKIDGSFVRSMNHHPANVAIVAAIVELAHNLGMRSVAEGVEDAATLETLAEIGADYVQGYVVARPGPLDTALTAESTTSFIEDPDLVRHIRELAAAPPAGDGRDTGNYH